MVPLIVLDIETTGLDYYRNSLLEVCMVFETFDKLPSALDSLTVRVKQDRAVIDFDIIDMHQTLIKQINEAPVDKRYRDSGRLYVEEREVVPTLNKWLERRLSGERAFACGKNIAGFDLPWLRLVATKWGQKLYPFHHRSLDIGSLYFTPDSGIPSMSKVLSELGVSSSGVHTAYGDALDCVRCVRNKFFGGPDECRVVSEATYPRRRKPKGRTTRPADARS